MTADEVRALPAVVDLTTAARVLGLGRSAAYELVRTGAWPTPVLRLGRLIKVPSAPLVELLCLGGGAPDEAVGVLAPATRGRG
jgi:predicted DNA-binding transcriptional regulator AlpA